MKILMVINTLQKGGKERRMLELIKGLKKHNGQFDIHLVSLTDIVDYPYVYDLPIKFEIIAKKTDGKDFSLIFRLRKIIKEFKPDIIHSWDTTVSKYLLIANAFYNRPMVHGIIYDASANKSAFNKSLYKRVKMISPFAKVIVANSHAGIKAYKTPLRKSICIHNGIDFNRFKNLKPAEQMELELLGEPKGNKFVLAMVAQFEIRKDYDSLIEAAARLCRKDKDFVFLLIGHGTMLEEKKAKVASALLDKQIRFLGSRQDVESILQIADAGLLLTNSDDHGEGISNSIVEYMASAKPVIATKGGGTDEIVLDGENGYLVEPKNIDQLSEKIEALKQNPELAKKMGKNAYEWVNKEFNIEKMTEAFIDLYRKYSTNNIKKVAAF
ncbi:MAG TPA: glycosyltransferase family 4 protein [Chitinophagaceae bacterium]|nr:glycosyltransferase family 4 protein [Chitinophagaceae bacterium]